MFDSLEIMRMAQSMAVHASTRQSVIAANVANADTPGYRSRDISSFANTYLDQGLELRATRDRHHMPSPAERPVPMEEAAGRESPNGNSVSLEAEILKAGEVRHQHEMALSIYRTSLDILRMSIGRR